jgi:integrase
MLRVKTKKYYTTYCSPEAVHAINSYLLTRSNLKPESPLFKVHPMYLMHRFTRINDELGLGKIGKYHRFRSHMLRKFHASQLYNNGMSLDEIDALQGRGKDATHSAYFLENPMKLRERYIEHLGAITINWEVIDIKSPEYIRLEQENKAYKDNLDELWNELNNMKKRQNIWEDMKE